MLDTPRISTLRKLCVRAGYREPSAFYHKRTVYARPWYVVRDVFTCKGEEYPAYLVTEDRNGDFRFTLNEHEATIFDDSQAALRWASKLNAKAIKL